MPGRARPCPGRPWPIGSAPVPSCFVPWAMPCSATSWPAPPSMAMTPRLPLLAPGRGKTRIGRLWAYARDEPPAGGNTPPAVAFRFSPDRKGKHPNQHLAGFAGTLHADGFAGFKNLYRTWPPAKPTKPNPPNRQRRADQPPSMGVGRTLTELSPWPGFSWCPSGMGMANLGAPVANHCEPVERAGVLGVYRFLRDWLCRRRAGAGTGGHPGAIKVLFWHFACSRNGQGPRPASRRTHCQLLTRRPRQP